MTAVEYLYKFLYEMESVEGFDPYSFNQKDVFNKAKEMEKQQRIDFADSYGTYLLVGGTMSAATYNETFKNTEK